MANISKIRLPNGTEYSLKDSNAAPLDSPAFTGTPTAPTASDGTATTQIATTAFVINNCKPEILTATKTGDDAFFVSDWVSVTSDYFTDGKIWFIFSPSSMEGEQQLICSPTGDRELTYVPVVCGNSIPVIGAFPSGFLFQLMYYNDTFILLNAPMVV